jgi:hypothetical protein
MLRRIYSLLFFGYYRLLFAGNLHDPGWAYVLGRKETYRSLLPYMTYMSEGFWWGFVGACVKKNKKIIEIPIHHARRLDGDTRVYKPGKMPGIIARNMLGLLKLRWAA